MPLLTPDAARVFWKALLDNASRLIADAQLLLDADSTKRARALSVLAMEELGKAVWIYDNFFSAWNDGSSEAREFALTKDHVKKYMQAFVFGGELEAFWGDYSVYDSWPQSAAEYEPWAEAREKESEDAARKANAQKKRGFYADLGAVEEPSESVDEVQSELTRAAQVIEMMLIKDHTRMQNDSVMPFDDTHEQQWRLLPTSHPEDFANFVAGAGHDLPDDDPDVQKGMEALAVLRQLDEIEDENDANGL